MSNISQSTIKNLSNNIYAYKKISIDKLKHEYEITVSSDYIEQKINSRLQEIAKNTKLSGFRLGKTPYDLVASTYKNEILKYVVSNTINYCSSDLIKKIEIESRVCHKIDIISLPELDKENKRRDFVYKLSFESMPKVPTIDLDKIILKRIEVKIKDEDIKEFIDSIKTEFPNFISISDNSYRAKNGDKLTIDFEGRIRNKLFQGGSGKNFSVNLGSGTFINNFESQLIDMKKGETKNFKLKFPENYQTIFLAGQEAVFSVKVNDIKTIKAFEDDNEIAKKIGFKDYFSLKNHAKKIINNQCKEMKNLLIKEELFNFLDTNYNFDLPIDMIKQEQQKIKNKLTNSKDESLKEVKRRVKLAMLFIKFSTKYKISLDQNDILNIILNQYVNKDVPLDKALRRFRSDKQFQRLVKGQALEHKITDFIIQKVNKKKQTISVKELKELFNKIK
ncbi:MAG: trigger factor [Wolbachia endosymbiont of Menacanthus eurysternus]|nr:MAG: trigger factor [Wolbachia endosymbiont of Menacanthus eurysternus]